MEVQVNGEWRAFPEGTTVAGLVEALGAAPQGIAVALDGEVVRRGDWAEVVVPAGARLEILTAVQGG
ncbi:sulfur carrier protein [Amycolatopsis bartoniae]|uniref:Thiamine biosynthesis protein ThiS n=1 Tax=Amycolatopsis bartoniae TaxID=941986 RepID=A0A8H9IW70_9PSEU|nr:sulfur carrier protein ThiS [Amycolatopsis bartoniae]MBB2935028.1 sulfur carrier protein [Amycolatopsis bartoniae]TVT00819.1 sulfur carrier protein ThiS [Amycolatopsis bartoniae]GHF73815.1 thiamine biosynthesis protein ThiS [Amycolatopsis bartoniae]